MELANGSVPVARAGAVMADSETLRIRSRNRSEIGSIGAATQAALRLPSNLGYDCIHASTVSAPPISVVIPVHNRDQVILRAIKSVLDLDECNFEIVIVDDASSDRTLEILRDVDDSRISVVSLRSNVGANVARNVGIALARAPIVAFLDSDDLYLGGRLSEPLRILGESPAVGVVISSFATRKGQKGGGVNLPEAIYSRDELLRLTARYILPPSTSGLTVRRDLLLACNGFNPIVRRMQDRDLLMRLAATTKGASVSQVLWEKHWSTDGISSQLNTQYDAISSFIALHPIYNTKELATRNYIIGRHLIALTKAGQWRRALDVYRHARRNLAPALPIMPVLLWKYTGTRWVRRQAKTRVLGKGIAVHA